MRILIDGDGCPVIDETLKVAAEYHIEAIIFCDTTHWIEREGIKVITVSKGNDAVDFKLVNEVKKSDVIVTQDYGLAAMGLAKGAYPIHQNGYVYNNENIDQLLFTRHIGKEIRRKGGRTKGPSKRTKEQNIAFYEGLKRLVERLLAEAN